MLNTRRVEDVAAAVLYEGFLLYPYRASAIKNRQRWTFGVVYPRTYAEAQSGADLWSMQTECLLRATAEASPRIRIRFLHLIARDEPEQAWQGAEEREIALPPLPVAELTRTPVCQFLTWPPGANQKALEIEAEASAECLDDDLYRLRATIRNRTPFAGESRDEALLHSLISTHFILAVEGGGFVSLLDPPHELRDAAAGCRNRGTWPVLAGDEGSSDAVLSAPIILYDYPQIAPESPGALFDGTEIDEILTLRILTLTDDEKQAMKAADERAREILERAESMPPEQFLKMHGVLRGLRFSGESS